MPLWTDVSWRWFTSTQMSRSAGLYTQLDCQHYPAQFVWHLSHVIKRTGRWSGFVLYVTAPLNTQCIKNIFFLSERQSTWLQLIYTELTEASFLKVPHPHYQSVEPFNTYSEGQLMTSEDPDARDGAVFVGAKQGDTGKGILSQFVQALVHT